MKLRVISGLLILVALIGGGIYAYLFLSAPDAPTLSVSNIWIKASVTTSAQNNMAMETTDDSGMQNVSMPGSSSPEMSANLGTSAIYLNVANAGKTADRLIRVQTPIAETVQIHKTVTQNGMSVMLMTDSILIPARGKVELKPGGMHIMLMGLRQPLNPGDTFPVTLVFENSGEINLEVQVRTP
jgi:periplasmic copper chaperone A